MTNNFGYPTVPSFEYALAVNVTGHRPNKLPGGYDPYATGNLEMLLAVRKQVEAYISNGMKYFISGGALGIDLWFARVVLALRAKHPHIKLYMYIPCDKQYKKWNASSKKEWQNVLEQADGVYFVSEKEYTHTCMDDRNKAMVKDCRHTLAVHIPSETRGGTMNCINDAKKAGNNITGIDPFSLAVTTY